MFITILFTPCGGSIRLIIVDVTSINITFTILKIVDATEPLNKIANFVNRETAKNTFNRPLNFSGLVYRGIGGLAYA